MSSVSASPRPWPVTTTGVILAIQAVLAVLAVAGSYLGALLVGDVAFWPLVRSTGLFLALAVLNGVLAYHVLRGSQWARVAVIVVGVIEIVVGVLRLIALIAGDPVPGERLVALVGSGGSFVLLGPLLVLLLCTEPARRFFADAR